MTDLNKYIQILEESDKGFTNVFCKQIKTKSFIRYFDDSLINMYDHNYFKVEDINEDILKDIYKIKQERKENFIKISSSNRLKDKLDPSFEEEIDLSMVSTREIKPKNALEGLSFSFIDNNEEYLEELIDIEIEGYAESYGEEFCRRRWIRYFKEVKEDKGLNIVLALYKDKVVGYAYIYSNNEVVQLDGLEVKKEYRHKGIATSLFSFVSSYFSKPIYLHADNEDTPKEMYLKLGFISIRKEYSYLLLDK